MLKKFSERLLDKILLDLTSRKWLAFLIVIVLSFVALMNDKITTMTWGAVSTAGLGLFSAANVAQKIKANLNDDGGKPK